MGLTSKKTIVPRAVAQGYLCSVTSLNFNLSMLVNTKAKGMSCFFLVVQKQRIKAC